MACARGLSVSQFAQLFIEIAVDERLIGKIVGDHRPRSRRRRPESVRICRPRLRHAGGGGDFAGRDVAITPRWTTGVDQGDAASLCYAERAHHRVKHLTDAGNE
jgi:hypothetical protein